MSATLGAGPGCTRSIQMVRRSGISSQEITSGQLPPSVPMAPSTSAARTRTSSTPSTQTAPRNGVSRSSAKSLVLRPSDRTALSMWVSIATRTTPSMPSTPTGRSSGASIPAGESDRPPPLLQMEPSTFHKRRSSFFLRCARMAPRSGASICQAGMAGTPSSLRRRSVSMGPSISAVATAISMR